MPGSYRVRFGYDDVLDVMRGLLIVVPVQEDWYHATYPNLADYCARFHETATTHFRKHGYFEGRQPFPPGWQGLQQPPSFLELKTAFRTFVTRGRVQVEIQRGAFLALVKRVLRLVPVDENWYCTVYPDAAETIRSGQFISAHDHFVTCGYFVGLLPSDPGVDEDWYVARYPHVRNGLAAGVATSATDHFFRIGYGEGCQPTP